MIRFSTTTDLAWRMLLSERRRSIAFFSGITLLIALTAFIINAGSILSRITSLVTSDFFLSPHELQVFKKTPSVKKEGETEAITDLTISKEEFELLQTLEHVSAVTPTFSLTGVESNADKSKKIFLNFQSVNQKTLDTFLGTPSGEKPIDAVPLYLSLSAARELSLVPKDAVASNDVKKLNEAVIGKRWNIRVNLALPTNVPPFQHAEEREITVQVVALRTKPFSYLPIDSIENYFNGLKLPYQFVSVFVSSEEFVSAVSKKIEEGELRVRTQEDIREEMGKASRTSFRFVYGFASIFFFLALLLLFQLIGKNIRDRSQDIGMMRAMGASVRDVYALIAAETTIVALIGSIIGVGLGYLGSIILATYIVRTGRNTYLEGHGIQELLIANFVQNLILIAIVFSASILVSILLTRRLTRHDPASLLAGH